MGNEMLRVSCSRCNQVMTVRKDEYQRENGEVYCDECFVPFICTDCGKRKYTLPENVSPNSSLRCDSCRKESEQTHTDNGTVESDSPALRLKLVPRALSVIFALLAAILFYYSQNVFFQGTTTDIEILFGLTAYSGSVFSFGVISWLCWKWEPYNGFTNLLYMITIRFYATWFLIFVVVGYTAFSIGLSETHFTHLWGGWGEYAPIVVGYVLIALMIKYFFNWEFIKTK